MPHYVAVDTTFGRGSTAKLDLTASPADGKPAVDHLLAGLGLPLLAIDTQDVPARPATAAMREFSEVLHVDVRSAFDLALSMPVIGRPACSSSPPRCRGRFQFDRGTVSFTFSFGSPTWMRSENHAHDERHDIFDGPPHPVDGVIDPVINLVDLVLSRTHGDVDREHQRVPLARILTDAVA